jgi:hypothetical protein
MDNREFWVISPAERSTKKKLSLLQSVQTALGFINPPVRYVPGDVSPGVKRPESGTDHSSQSSGEVKIALNLRFPTRRHVVLLKHRDKLTLPYISLKTLIWRQTVASSAKTCILSHLQTNASIIYARFRQQCRPGYGCQFLGQLFLCGAKPVRQPSHNPLQQLVVWSRHPDRIQRR